MSSNGSDAEGHKSGVLLSLPLNDDKITDTSSDPSTVTVVMDNVASSKNAVAKIHQGQKDDNVPPRVDEASYSVDTTHLALSEQLIDEDVDGKPGGIVVGSPRLVDDNGDMKRGVGGYEDEGKVKGEGMVLSTTETLTMEESKDSLSPSSIEIAETTSVTKLMPAELIVTLGEEGGGGHNVSSPQMMGNYTSIPRASDHDIMENFHIQSPKDKKVFETVLGWLQEYESNTIPTNVVAATLTLIVKGLAVHGAGLASGHFLGGNLRVLTDFVRYQSSLYGRDNGIFTSSYATTPPVTLVQLARHCSDIVNKWSESEGMYCHFMEYYDFGSARGITPFATTPSSENVLSFQQMLLNTLSCIHLNTIESLEDLSDFEHLWSSTLNDFRSNSMDEASGGGTPKRKRSKSYDDAVNIRLVAKELAWVLSRSSYYSQSKIDDNRKQRILRAASCIDFVVAALMAPIIASPDKKPRRFEFGNIDPRRSIEDEAAAALSSMHLGGGSTFDTALREKSKKMLLKAASDLLSSVTVEPSSILHKDIVRCAQQVALSVLSLLEGKIETVSLSENSSPASQLLSLFISHKVRMKNLDVLKESYASAISDKVTTDLSALLDEIHPLNMSWIISKLQRNTFTVSIFNLSPTERKFVAPFASSNCPQEQREDPLRAEAMIYYKPSKPMTCNAIQISRVKNPTTTDDELNDVNEWITSLHEWPTSTSCVEPSSWLVNYFQNHTEGLWNKIVIPVLNFFLAIVARDCQLDPDAIMIAEDGVYNTKQGNESPGAVLRLYYSALEAIIRNKSRADIYNTRGNLDDKRFHSSLFSLCYFTLQKAKKPDGRCFLIEDIGQCPIAFAKLVDLFIDEFQLRSANELSEDSDDQFTLPSYLSRVLRQLKEMILTMIWMEIECDTNESTSFLNMVIEMRSNAPDKWSQTCSDAMKHTRGQSLVGYVMHNLIDVTKQRTTDMCEMLNLPSSSSTTEMTMDLFQNLLHYRTEIFYNRHPDQLMLCCLYASICAQSKHGPVVNFQRIADTYTQVRHDLGSELSYAILYRIKNCSDRADEFGDIVSLYNEVFLSCVKYLWQTIKKTGQQSKIDELGHDSDTHDSDTVDSFEDYSIVMDDESVDVSSPETTKKESNARSSDDDTTSIDSKDKMDISDGSEDDHGCESETVARGKVKPSEKKADISRSLRPKPQKTPKAKIAQTQPKIVQTKPKIDQAKPKIDQAKHKIVQAKPKIVKVETIKVVSKVATDPSDKQRIADAIAAVNAVYGVGHERERKLLEARLRGVTQRPSRKWQAQLYYAGKSRYIGVFDNKEQAALAYEIARDILKDEKQPLNVTADECEKNVNLAREAAFEGIGVPTLTQPSPPLHLCGSKDELVGANVYVYKGQYEGRTGTLLDRKTTGWCTIEGIESKVQISSFAVVDDGKINLRALKGTPRVMPRIITPDEMTKAMIKFREEGPSKDIPKSE